jgi:hypothetical protein
MAKTKFTAADVERACAGVRKAGIDVATVEMRPDGSILVTTAAAVRNASPDDPRELRTLL